MGTKSQNKKNCIRTPISCSFLFPLFFRHIADTDAIKPLGNTIIHLKMKRQRVLINDDDRENERILFDANANGLMPSISSHFNVIFEIK